MRMPVQGFVLCVAATGAIAAPAGAKVPRVVKVGTPPKSASPGGRLRLSVRARPATAKLGVYLSRDRRRDKHDTSLGSARPRKGAISVKLPKRVKPATYHVLVCAKRRCVASARTVRVAANPLAGLPSLSAAPSPVTVHPATDAAHAATKTIGKAGGDVTATGADGSTYTLSIPAGALLRDEAIALTPVTSIGGLPFTKAAPAAVQLGPDGLQLQVPATLTVVPAHPAPLAQQVGFGWHGDGADFHMSSVGSDRTKLVLTLWHFSGAGVGGATPDQRAAQQQHLPQTPEDRLDQQLAEALDANRRNDGTVDDQAEADLFASAFDHVVLPAIKAASADDTRLADAVTTLLSWARMTAVLTDPDKAGPGIKKRWDQVIPLFTTLLDATYGKAKERCEAGDPSQVARLLQIGHLQAILGMPESPATTDAMKCATFKFTIDDNIDYEELGVYVKADWHVDDLPLAPDEQGRIQSTATLQDGGWSVSPKWIDPAHCTTEVTGQDSGPPMTVALDLDYNWRTEKDAQGIDRDVVGPAKITLRLIDGRPTNNFNVNCVDSQGRPRPPIPYAWPDWTMAWMSRQSWLDMSTGAFTQTFTASRTSPEIDVSQPYHQDFEATTIDDTLHIRLEHATG